MESFKNNFAIKLNKKIMMRKTKLISNLLAICFLASSCSTPAKFDVDLIRNHDYLAISSVGIAFKIDVPTKLDNIYYNIKTNIGIINLNQKFHFERKVNKSIEKGKENFAKQFK